MHSRTPERAVPRHYFYRYLATIFNFLFQSNNCFAPIIFVNTYLAGYFHQPTRFHANTL